MAFCIITDSASDLPREIIEEYGVGVVPTPVVIDGIDYFDGKTIFPDEFYQKQAEGHEISTYHVSQMMFYDFFKPYAERGDELLYICFSTGIAGTYQAANLAVEDLKEEFPSFAITIIDSKCASVGYGLVVYKLLQMQKNGADRELLIEAASFFCAHMKHAVTVQTLEYLYKGGRLSRTSAVLGGMLDIKPIIVVNEEGALDAVEKIRGWKKALHHIVDMTGREGAQLSRQTVGIVHGKMPELLDFLEKELGEKYGVTKFMRGQIGCAIGAHIGPGTAGIVCQDAIDERFEKYLD